MVNKVTLLGRLGKDPAIKHFSDNNAIAEFSLATTDNYKDREGKWVETTEWHNVKLPTKWMAESAEKYLKKGSLVYIEGRIKTRSYDDKDGNKKYITEIVADMLRRLDKREGGPSSGGEQNQQYQGAASSQSTQQDYSQNDSRPASNIDDDLPF